MEASGHYLCTLSQPHSSSYVSLEKELVRFSGTLIFVGVTLGAPLGHLVLVAS